MGELLKNEVLRDDTLAVDMWSSYHSYVCYARPYDTSCLFILIYAYAIDKH